MRLDTGKQSLEIEFDAPTRVLPLWPLQALRREPAYGPGGCASGERVQQRALRPYRAGQRLVIGNLTGILQLHVQIAVGDFLQTLKQRLAAAAAYTIDQHIEAPHPVLTAQYLDQRIGIGQ